MSAIRTIVALAQSGRIDNALQLWKSSKVGPHERSAFLSLGAQLHESREELSVAEELFRKAIKKDRNNYTARVGLGRILRKQGRPEVAANHLRHLLRSRPGDPELTLALSLALRDMQRVDEAVQTLAQLAASSRDARILYNYGNLLAEARRTAEAVRVLEAAVSYDPRNAAIWNSLGAALLNAARPNDALDALSKAVVIDPVGIPARNNLGRVFAALGDYEQAKSSFLNSLGIDSRQPATWNSLANVYRELLEFDEAAAILRQVIRDYPDDPSAYLNLAALHEERNALACAQQTVEKAAENGVISIELDLMRARLLRRQKDFVGALSLLESLQTHNSQESVKRYYELARCSDASGQFEDAWKAANERHNVLKESLSDETRSAIVERYLRSGAQRLADASCEPAVNPPIFLVGFPRSGTTLLGRILGAHPDVSEMEEEPLVERLLDDIPSWPGEPLTRQVVTSLRERYDRMAKAAGGDGVILDRMPINIIHVPLIRTLWPNAKIVVLLRHPMDVCVSCVFQEFRVNWLTRHLSSFADASAMFEKVMSRWLHWRDSVDAIELSYEALVASPRDTVSVLIDRLDLRAVNASQLILDRLSAPAAKTASYSQVNERIHQQSVRRYEHYLPYMDKSAADRLFELARRLGYSVSAQRKNVSND